MASDITEDVASAIQEATIEAVDEYTRELAQTLVKYTVYDAIVDASNGYDIKLAEEIEEKVTVEVENSDGLSRNISFVLDGLSEDAQERFEFYLDNAQIRAFQDAEE